jgi:hypothetical protein
MEIGVRARFLILLAGLALPAAAQEQVLRLPSGEELRYEFVQPGTPWSARDTAFAFLRYLAQGEIEAAASLSNAPQQRLEVLRAYQRSVGEAEFKRLYGRYFAPENRLLAEAAIGNHRLLVWDLGEANNYLAGQFFVQADGRFLLNDVPSAERQNLQRLLEAYRKKTAN